MQKTLQKLQFLECRRQIKCYNGGNHRVIRLCINCNSVTGQQSRGVEYDLLPWLTKHQVALMAYCPLAQAGDLKKNMLKNQILLKVAEKYGITPYQLLLAFVLRDENVIAIPRSGNKEHVKANAYVRNLTVSREDFALLDKAFPAPGRKTYLDII